MFFLAVFKQYQCFRSFCVRWVLVDLSYCIMFNGKRTDDPLSAPRETHVKQNGLCLHSGLIHLTNPLRSETKSELN